ncbi:MAG: hypothetical protein KAX65_03570 [Caldilineaceae bacterium]|nr:hypothetical protein [Caldilineaceae bacterium]
MTTITLTVTVDLGGDQAQDAAAKIADLLPDRNGLLASGIAGIVLRRLCATGMVAGYPAGWRIEAAEVR